MIPYTLIIWTYLCTAVDPSCETGDMIVMDEYRQKNECFSAGASWKLSHMDHRFACVRKDTADDLRAISGR